MWSLSYDNHFTKLIQTSRRRYSNGTARAIPIWTRGLLVQHETFPRLYVRWRRTGTFRGPLPTLSRLIAFAVDNHLLHHTLRLPCAHFPIGWLRRQSIRVFHRDGHFRCLCGQFLQRVGNQCLDRLGIFRCSPRQCPHPVVYCEWSLRCTTTVTYVCFKAVYNSISPGWFSTPVYGNNHFLWSSPYFWFSIVLTFFLALAPRYLYKSYNFIFNPDDFEIMRWAKKVDPHRDFAKDSHTGGQLSRLRPSTRSGVSSAMGSAAPSRSTLDGERPGAPPLRTTSRTDMSTGLRSTHRGFDFAAEEGGPAMRRLQSNLSAPRPSETHLPHGLGDKTKQKISFANLRNRNPLKRRRPRTISQEGHDKH